MPGAGSSSRSSSSSGHSGWPAHSTIPGQRRRGLRRAHPLAHLGAFHCSPSRPVSASHASDFGSGATPISWNGEPGWPRKWVEIEPQDAEEGDPTVGVTLELVVPVIAAGEPAVNDTHDTGAPGARFDDPLRGDGRVIRSHVVPAVGHEPVGWLPGRDGGERLHAGSKVADDGAAFTLFDCGRNEPG